MHNVWHSRFFARSPCFQVVQRVSSNSAYHTWSCWISTHQRRLLPPPKYVPPLPMLATHQRQLCSVMMKFGCCWLRSRLLANRPEVSFVPCHLQPSISTHLLPFLYSGNLLINNSQPRPPGGLLRHGPWLLVTIVTVNNVALTFFSFIDCH